MRCDLAISPMRVNTSLNIFCAGGFAFFKQVWFTFPTGFIENYVINH
jgi:hypothetical protein